MEYRSYFDTPIGGMYTQADEHGITAVHFVERLAESRPNQHTLDAQQQLVEYFNGKRTEFDLPLRASGTPFQQRVWAALRQIPFGATTSYADIASKIEQPNASRAVGMANGRNPLTIVVPCHRVIGNSGKLTGYASGLQRKQWLLGHEQSIA